MWASGTAPRGQSPAGPDRSGEARYSKEDIMGYVFFILIAFVMLGVERLVARHEHGHEPHPGA